MPFSGPGTLRDSVFFKAAFKKLKTVNQTYQI